GQASSSASATPSAVILTAGSGRPTKRPASRTWPRRLRASPDTKSSWHRSVSGDPYRAFVTLSATNQPNGVTALCEPPRTLRARALHPSKDTHMNTFLAIVAGIVTFLATQFIGALLIAL